VAEVGARADRAASPARIPRREAVRVAILSAIVATLSFLLGSRFTALFHGSSAIVGGLWSLISAVVVLQATRRATIDLVWRRLFGTFIGAALSAIYLSLFPFSLAGLAPCVGASVLGGLAAGAPDHARLAAITVAVVMATAKADPTVPPLLDAALRFAESCIGTAITAAAVFAWPEALPAGRS
jgi:uncharacterized membrane protein YccC